MGGWSGWPHWTGFCWPVTHYLNPAISLLVPVDKPCKRAVGWFSDRMTGGVTVTLRWEPCTSRVARGGPGDRVTQELKAMSFCGSAWVLQHQVGNTENKSSWKKQGAEVPVRRSCNTAERVNYRKAYSLNNIFCWTTIGGYNRFQTVWYRNRQIRKHGRKSEYITYSWTLEVKFLSSVYWLNIFGDSRSGTLHALKIGTK